MASNALSKLVSGGVVLFDVVMLAIQTPKVVAYGYGSLFATAIKDDGHLIASQSGRVQLARTKEGLSTVIKSAF